MEHWKTLIPVDRYIVRSQGLLHDFDRKILTLLYQPLIGVNAYSFFMTLWSELNLSNGEEKTHHALMGTMQVNLPVIFEVRKKLEGIGLLKTYVNQDEETRLYVYELIAPLGPMQFFNDGVLNIYLYNKIGKTNYSKLKEYFSISTFNNESFNDVTHSFNDVYSSIHSSELHASDEMMKEFELDANREFINRSIANSIEIKNSGFDFDLFFSGLKDSLISIKDISDSLRDTIEKLSFIYRIDPIEMQKVVLSALETQTGKVDEERLRKEARDWYQLEHKDTLPHFIDKTHPIAFREFEDNQPLNKDDELGRMLEKVTPYQLLKDLSGGSEPSVSDLEIIEEVMVKQKLLPGVTNVLIYYVMLRSDMRLTKNYVTKIAAHWARKNLNTVSEAMNLAKEEHKQYQGWIENKKKTSPKKKVIRQELIPDWLKEKKELEQTQVNETKDSQDEKKESFDELLKNFRE